MMFFRIFWAALLLGSVLGVEDQEKEAQAFIKDWDLQSRKFAQKAVQASWTYATNITDENAKNQSEASLAAAEFVKGKWKELAKYPWRDFKNETLKRMFHRYSSIGTAALPEQEYRKFLNTTRAMKELYNKGVICDFFNKSKCDLPLAPDVSDILAKSRNPDQLKYTWLQWYNTSGKPARPLFEEYVKFKNEAAKLNNFTDAQKMWLDEFEDEKIQTKFSSLMSQLDRLYKAFHAYVRFRLRQHYGEEVVGKSGPIPEYLLGNMWGQSWANIMDIITPYPDSKPVNITESLLKQDYTPQKIFKASEHFFTSINMSAMVPNFWEKSLLEKPKDRAVVCHASAWDMQTGDDFRIKQCTQVNQEHFYVAHHEMGHTEYQMAYRNQPHVFQDGANSGFHEAVGDAIALSVSTPKHLIKIGLLNVEKGGHEIRINHLFSSASTFLASIPFAYLLDVWRWQVFNGTYTPKEYNCKYWELKMQYQGVVPPEPRSEEYFDPAGKYHIASDVPYIRYFVSRFLQFQFHKALCEKADEYEPNNPDKSLWSCDIYSSPKAGNAFKAMLERGASRPWPETLEVLTGKRDMDASPILEYFEELLKWLEEQNEKNGEHVGWEIPEEYTCAGQAHRRS